MSSMLSSIVHLKQILRGAADDAVYTGFFFRCEVLEIAAGFRKVKGQEFHLRRPPAVKRRFVGEDVVFHIGHGRAAEDQHQLGRVLVLVDQKLDGGSEAFRRAGHIRVFVDGKDDALLFGQLEHVLQSRLKGQERGLGVHARVIAQNAFAEIFEVLLGIALNAHKIDGVLIGQ